MKVSLTSLLFAIFLTLKLTHVINWSWWWVFAPFWVPMALFLFGAIIAVIINSMKK